MTQTGGTAAVSNPSIHSSLSASKPLLLRMQGIVKRYGSVAALSGVDFEVRSGEIHALLGENGAGKTTLMHVLAGLAKADSGSIILSDRPVNLNSALAARRHGIAMVHQHFTLVPAFTASENWALDSPQRAWPALRPFRVTEAAHRAFDHASALGWELPTDTRVADLSIGVQQRIEIVKALATEAKILIFDEPTAVLTGAEIGELFATLRHLREEGRTVILIAHKLAEIQAVADRVTVLRRGSVVASTAVSMTDARQLAAWMTGDPPISSASDPINSSSAPKSAALLASELVVSDDRGNQVLNGITLDASRGEIVGIGGVDGNGQAELAEALAGLRAIDSGSLTWDDEDFDPRGAPRIGYIPQDRRRMGLAITMTVGENLVFDAAREARYRCGPFLRRRALNQLADDLIQQFDIRTSGRSQPVSSLSGGNQQKVVVARALRENPDLVIAMNPTRGLDINATRFVYEQLRAARIRGASIVLISTDMDEIAALSDRAVIISSGKLTPYVLDSRDTAQLGLLLGGFPANSESQH